jgi:hypothetical protein
MGMETFKEKKPGSTFYAGGDARADHVSTTMNDPSSGTAMAMLRVSPSIL